MQDLLNYGTQAPSTLPFRRRSADGSIKYTRYGLFEKITTVNNVCAICLPNKIHNLTGPWSKLQTYTRTSQIWRRNSLEEDRWWLQMVTHWPSGERRLRSVQMLAELPLDVTLSLSTSRWSSIRPKTIAYGIQTSQQWTGFDTS